MLFILIYFLIHVNKSIIINKREDKIKIYKNDEKLIV
jgi:hypothetical protein